MSNLFEQLRYIGDEFVSTEELDTHTFEEIIIIADWEGHVE